MPTPKKKKPAKKMPSGAQQRKKYGHKSSIKEKTTIGDAVKVLGGPLRGRLRRGAEELREPVWVQIRMDAISYELLKIHALQRRVKVTPFISDILNGWLANATDYSQALVREMLPAGARAMPVPERWGTVGYLASLGYKKAVEEQLPPDPPDRPIHGFDADLSPRHDVPPPPDTPVTVAPVIAPEPAAAPSEVAAAQADPDAALSPDMVAMVEAKGGSNPEVEYDPLAYGGAGVGRFDPEEHRKMARAPGHGNAAQARTMGFDPASLHPDAMNRNKDR
jgi:hypothetical protein